MRKITIIPSKTRSFYCYNNAVRILQTLDREVRSFCYTNFSIMYKKDTRMDAKLDDLL